MCVFSFGSLKCHQLDNLVSWMANYTNFDIISFMNLDRLITLRILKIGFWVEQCMHSLFEYPEVDNAITKNHNKAVSGAFCVISLFLQKMILGVT